MGKNLLQLAPEKSAGTCGAGLPLMEPPGEPVRIGSNNHLKKVGACHHYDSVRDRLGDVANTLRSNPEAEKKLLLATGSWKYWDDLIESNRRHQGRRTRV